MSYFKPFIEGDEGKDRGKKRLFLLGAVGAILAVLALALAGCSDSYSGVGKSSVLSCVGSSEDFPSRLIQRDGDLNVYVVQTASGHSFKRLMVSPEAVNAYSYDWGKIEQLATPEELDAYEDSVIVCEVGTTGPNLYKLYPEYSGDEGVKRLLWVTRGQFMELFDLDSVFAVNAAELQLYETGAPLSYADLQGGE